VKSRSRKERGQPAIVEATAPHASTWSTWSIVVGVCFVAYLIAFFRGSLGLPTAPEMTRGSLWQFVLIPDELAANWFGENGDWEIRDRVPILAGALLIHTCALLLGWPFMQYLPQRCVPLRLLERLLLTDGVGLSFLSVLMLALGLKGDLRRPVIIPSCIAGLIGAMLWYLDWRKRSNPSPRFTRVSGSDWLSLHWLWLAAPFVLLVMLGGMLPPIEFDVREYHLQAPKEFYQNGRIEFLPHNVYANMPLGAEMWALAAMVIKQDWWRGALVGKTVIASLLPLTALALLAIGTRLGSRTAGIVAALLYVSFPWLLQVSMLGLIEGAVAHFVALTLLAICIDRTAEIPPWQQFLLDGLAGYFAGSAAACKYPALLFVVAPVVAWVGWSARAHGAFVVCRRVLFAALCALSACGPWLAKNWVLTGNPTYPLFYSVFDGATRTPKNAAQWREAHRPHGFGPLELFEAVKRVLLDSPWLGPMIWPLATLAAAYFVMDRRRGAATQAALDEHRTQWWAMAGFVAFIFACWWLFTHRIDRFWLPAAPPLALLAGYGAARISELLLRRVVMVLLGVGLLWSLIVVASPLIAYNPYFAPLAELRNSPVRVDPWILELNRRGGKVLSIGEAAVFDFEQPVLYNTTFDPSWLERYHVGDLGASTEETLAAFDKLVAEHGLDLVYVDWDEIARYRAPGNYGFDARVTPELFELLVDEGRLTTPLKGVSSSRGEVYPVQR